MMIFLLLLTLLGSSNAQAGWDWDEPTPMDVYVNAPEAVYGYTELDTFLVPEATVHVLNMTSLTWFDETLTTTPVWWHYQVVVIPDAVVYTDAALLYIVGGNMNDTIPTEEDEYVQSCVDFSVNTGAVCSVLKQIPNQPLTFLSDQGGTNPRIEDAIVAYSWQLYIEATVDDMSVNVLYPMAKACKLAVDTLIDFVPTVAPTITITEVMPTGFDKRGWATGLMTIMDQRMFAAAPNTIDLLNWHQTLNRHYQSMGGWSWAFVPYYNAGISFYLNDPRAAAMADTTDPYNYMPRLTIPAVWGAGAGDQFMLPDDSHNWLSQMPNEIHWVMFENDDHNIDTHRPLIWENIECLFIWLKDGTARPQYSFVRDPISDPATITLTSVTTPTEVRAWWADNTNRTCEPNDDITGTCRRDFRVSRNDLPTDTLISWTNETLVEQGGGVYVASYPHRTDFGYRIFHIEVIYPGPGGRQFHVTSEVNVIEDVFPYPECVTPEECRGVLK